MRIDAKSAKTGLWGVAAGGGLAVLAQMGIVTPPSFMPSVGDIGLPVLEAGPVDFAMYEVPSFMSAVYEGKFDQTGFNPQFRTAYAIRVADSIRQSCRGPFTTAQISQWENKVARDAFSQITPEYGMKVLENNLRTMMDVYNDPSKLADLQGGMPSAEELPMKAQQDTMMFVQDHTCNGPVFDKFTSNLGEVAGMETVAPENQRKM